VYNRGLQIGDVINEFNGIEETVLLICAMNNGRCARKYPCIITTEHFLHCDMMNDKYDLMTSDLWRCFNTLDEGYYD